MTVIKMWGYRINNQRQGKFGGSCKVFAKRLLNEPISVQNHPYKCKHHFSEFIAPEQKASVDLCPHAVNNPSLIPFQQQCNPLPTGISEDSLAFTILRINPYQFQKKAKKYFVTKNIVISSTNKLVIK